MTKKSTKAEINSFIGGINTEANPINFPPNASRDEENFEMNKNGTRERRLGIDYEADHVLFSLGVSASDYEDRSFNTFRWQAAGGDFNNSFVVLQSGNTLHFFDSQVESISGDGFLSSITITEFPVNVRFSFTSVDGYLIVVSGEELVVQVTYSSGSFSYSTERIKVRDIWGVENIGSEYETNPLFRAATAPSTHIYNLRNQSWALPRKRGGVLQDPIRRYFNNLDVFPSNSEMVWTGMVFSASSEPPSEIFIESLMRDRLGAENTAAKGYFLIDLLRRGNSRLEEYSKLMDANSELIYDVASLPEDVTEGGPTATAEYAGRVWFAGFNGDAVNGDARSPRLSSYVAFSQLVSSKLDFYKCYQSGDPTSRETTDIVDTDGGVIRISDAQSISKMVAIGRELVVFGTNGVWTISGGSDYGFTATNYSVERLSAYGCISPDSVTVVGDSIFFWSEDGINVIQRDQFGKLGVSNITQATIQTLYENIDITEKRKVKGIYDPFDRKVRWLYNTDSIIGNNNFVNELIFDVNTSAFTKNKIYNLVTNSPEVIDFISTDPYRKGSMSTDIVVSGDPVVVLGDPVVITDTIRTTGTVSIKYVTVVLDAGLVKVTFSQYRNQEFLDWKTADGVGADATAYMLTGEITAGDSSVHKQVPYLIMHFLRTEFTATNGVPDNQSGCLVRSQWDWANSIASGKWSDQFQAYRYRRPFFVTGREYDNGFETVITRNKLRGRGRAFSLRIDTEAGKDCRILGWVLALNGNATT